MAVPPPFSDWLTSIDRCLSRENKVLPTREPIAALRDEYHLLTKDLPPCPECKRARDKAAQVLGRKYRRLV